MSDGAKAQAKQPSSNSGHSQKPAKTEALTVKPTSAPCAGENTLGHWIENHRAKTQARIELSKEHGTSAIFEFLPVEGQLHLKVSMKDIAEDLIKAIKDCLNAPSDPRKRNRALNYCNLGYCISLHRGLTNIKHQLAKIGWKLGEMDKAWEEITGSDDTAIELTEADISKLEKDLQKGLSLAEFMKRCTNFYKILEERSSNNGDKDHASDLFDLDLQMEGTILAGYEAGHLEGIVDIDKFMAFCQGRGEDIPNALSIHDEPRDNLFDQFCRLVDPTYQDPLKRQSATIKSKIKVLKMLSDPDEIRKIREQSSKVSELSARTVETQTKISKPRGRPSASPGDEKKDEQFCDGWNQAKMDGISFKEYCSQQEVNIKTGNQILDRHRRRMARRTSCND
jgi:hypothetical protein